LTNSLNKSSPSNLNSRHVIIEIGDRVLDASKLRHVPGIEVYHANGPETEDQIDIALLNDLVMPLKLVFVGDEGVRLFAEEYHADWIQCSPTAVDDILRTWSKQL
jgi:hypothetical protein